MDEEVTITMLLAEGTEVRPTWKENRGTRYLTYEPARVVEEYPSSIVPRVGEYIVINKPVRMAEALHAQVAAVVHHWTAEGGAVAYVILRSLDATAPIPI